MTRADRQQPIDPGGALRRQAGEPIRLEQYFQAMIKANASDLHLKADSSPHIRIATVLRAPKSEPLSAEDLESMARELLTEAQRAYFDQTGSVDLAYELVGSDRFRINVYRQRGRVSVAIRRVTRDIPDFQTLRLPPVAQRIAEEHQGLILLAGPTGSGKSTTIASMLEHINTTRACHIVTIEDPIEYLYEDKKALVDQREIGIDVVGYASALRSLMREDPDVVLIGEMRDRETFESALQAAETGHQVFGTIHASTAPSTISRILDLFPSASRALVRRSLAMNLKAIICQRLLPSLKPDVQRVPAVEVLLTNPAVRKLIEEGRDDELSDVIGSNERHGMQSFTRSLLTLIEGDFIDPKVAYEVAPNVEELRMLMKGISPSRSGLVTRR